MNENFSLFKDKNINEQKIKFLVLNNKKKYFSLQNNNDTIEIICSSLSYLRAVIFSIYNKFIYCVQSLNHFIFKCHFLLLIIFMLFTYVISLENNSDIPTSLIISAYFPNRPITRITYDMLLEKEKNMMKIKYKEYQKNNKVFNHNQNDLIENYITCDESHGKVPVNKNIQNNNNKKSINDGTSLKIMFSQMNKQKTNFQNWNTTKNRRYLVLNKELFINIIFIMVSFLYLYFLIKYTIYSKIKDSFYFNIICIIITFNILNLLYKFGFYFSSNFYFVAFIYINKCLIESVFILLKYKRKDFEVFSTSLIAFNMMQFKLKFIILLSLSTFSGILSIFIFRTCLNFILFYVCLFTLFVFLSNCLEIVDLLNYYPKKNTIIFFLGIFNLIFSKLLSNYLINKFSLFNILKRKNSIDSLYLISDLFTLFCFSYTRKNIEYQIETILLINHFINKSTKNSNYDFSIIWPFRYAFCILLSFLGIYKKEKMCLLMSIYLTKIITSYLINIYDVQKCKFLYYIFCILYLIFNVEFFGMEENSYLINLFFYYTRINKDFISLILKIFFSLLVYYFIITINFNIIISSSQKTKYDLILKEILGLLDEKFEPDGKTQEDPFSLLLNCVLIYLDLLCNFFLICSLIAIYQYYEVSKIIKIINCITLAFQFVSKTLYLKNIKNLFYYYFSNFLWLMFCLRLISLCQNEYSLMFCFSHFNIEFFLYIYFTNLKDNILLDIIFFISLIVRCWQLRSLFLFTYIVIFVLIVAFLYLYNNIKYINENENKNNKEMKENNENFGIENIYISLSLLFLIPIISFFLIRLKFSSHFYLLNYLDLLIKDIISIISIYARKIKAKDYYDWIDSIEFILIRQGINYVKIIKNEIYI